MSQVSSGKGSLSLPGGLSPAGPASTWYDGIAQAIFGLAFVLSKQQAVETTSLVVMQTIDFAQMLNFAINSSPLLPWKGGRLEGTSRVLDVVSGDVFGDPQLEWLYTTLLVLASAWVLAFVSASVYTASAFVTGGTQSPVILRLLSGTASTSTTVAFLPLTTVLARAIGCPASAGDGWLSSGLACSDSLAIVLRIIIAMMLAMFAALALFLASVYVDRAPSSGSWSARTDGRIDVVMLAIKIVLVLGYTVTRDVLLRSWFVHVLLVGSGLAWVHMVWTSLPYTFPHMNALQGGYASGFLMGSLCLMMSVALNREDTSLLAIFGIPMAVVLGAAATYLREASVASQPLSQCTTLTEVHVWARHRVQAFAVRRRNDGFQMDSAAGSTYKPPPGMVVRLQGLHLSESAGRLAASEVQSNQRNPGQEV